MEKNSVEVYLIVLTFKYRIQLLFSFYDGTKLEMRINEPKNEICYLATSILVVVHLFVSLQPHVKPIVTKSHLYNDVDQKCTVQEDE